MESKTAAQQTPRPVQVSGESAATYAFMGLFAVLLALVTNCHQGQQAREKRECPIDNGFLPRQILGRHRAPTVLTLHAHPLAVSAESRLTLRTAGAAAITPPALCLRDSPTPY